MATVVKVDVNKLVNQLNAKTATCMFLKCAFMAVTIGFSKYYVDCRAYKRELEELKKKVEGE